MSSMPLNTSMKSVLTIGGHDLSHGAGITKDLEVFSALGCHGISVPTSFVVQGPGGVRSVTPVSEPLFIEMLQRANEDFALSGVKIGALADSGHVEIVADFLAIAGNVPVVLDPVLAAKNGRRLITDEGIESMVKRMFPLVTCLTPNVDEARLVLNAEIDDGRAMELAARKLADLGPSAVILKGGHLPGDPIDVLFDGRDVVTYQKRRIGRIVHGTGCMFSSALCTFLAFGYPMKEAFLETERVMERLIGASVRFGEDGYFYSFPGVDAGRDARKWAVFQATLDAGSRLEQLNMAELVPVGGMSVAYAIQDARGIEDVAGYRRIGFRRGRVRIEGPPSFGASPPLAKMCLARMKRHPFVRSVATVRYEGAIIEEARKAGLSVVCRDGKDASEIDCFTGDVAPDLPDAPADIMYDPSDVGRKPIMWLFARNPEELIKRMEMIRPCTTN